jgi:hypothetical protein
MKRITVTFGNPPPKKNDRHDIAEILLKVALNTINQTKQSKVS